MLKTKRIFLLLILLCLSAGCFWRNSSHRIYTIYRSSIIEGVNLQGKETSIQGFIDDLFYEIARRKGFRIKINTIANAKTSTLLTRPNADAAVGILEPTVQNRKIYDFSDPIYTFGPVVVMRKNETYDGLNSLKNKIVGFERAYAGAFENRNDLTFIFKPYDQMTYAMEDLVNGKIDAVILDSIRAYQLVASFYANTLKVASPPLQLTILCLIGIRGKDQPLIKLFNEGLQELKKESVYKKMLDYWGLVDPSLVQKSK